MTTAKVTMESRSSLLNKVPEVTLVFWIIKIMSTTVGALSRRPCRGRRDPHGGDHGRIPDPGAHLAGASAPLGRRRSRGGCVRDGPHGMEALPTPCSSNAFGDRPMSTNPLVIVRSVAKTYRRRQSKVDALDNVSLEVQNGEFVVLTGRSGSGKTTLLNLIAAPDHPDDGEINVRSTYHPHAARRGSKISQRAHRDRVLVPPFIAAGDRSRERPIAHGSRTDDGPPARDRTTRCSWTGRSKWASAGRDDPEH
jgi:ABC-type glutathione transport system ATPase component